MADDMKPLPAVYTAIANVMRDVGQEGIAKARRNDQQKYNFRGIDDVYNALAPILARHELIIVPRVLSREKTERVSIKTDDRTGVQRESVLFYVVVQVEFDIVCATDGSRITACTWGEAMDSADKATNKAMSAAYKYMAMQTFCIPTEGDNDADAHSHNLTARERSSNPAPRGNSAAHGEPGQVETPREQPPLSVSFTAHQNNDGIGKGKSSAQAKKDGDWQAVRERLDEELQACATRPDALAWWDSVVNRDEEYRALPSSWRQLLREEVLMPYLVDLPEVVG